ncbi:hypothetical protein [Arthrobacter sp. RAF14]|uniref:hypothetical protein n=1 Tax=Arthrobacter sp. RAF14 TaxID=3233051 RepID=UPI003F8E7FF0
MTKKDTVQLAKNLKIASRPAPGDQAPVWESGSVRKSRLRAAIMSTAVFVVVAAGIAVLLAWTTNPLWGNYPQVPATVVGKSEANAHKSTPICTVTLRFELDGVPHEATVRNEASCDRLPRYKEQVTLAYNPTDYSGMLIVGHDEGIRTATSMIALISVVPLLLLLWLSATRVRSYRNARKAASRTSWQEITVLVKGLKSNPEHTDLLVHARDDDGAEREFVIGYATPKLTGFEPQKDSQVTLRLVGDGDGHAVLAMPDGSGTCDATISTPNNFELRTLGL